MMFVMLAKGKAPSTMKQRISRRLEWQYPTSIRVVGEYWLQSHDPALVLITETEDAGAMMRSIAEWDDVFDLQVFPAVSAEQGLQAAKEMAAART